MAKTIIVELNYGLGNLMFQYAFGRILQLHYGCKVICDFSQGTSYGGPRGLIKVTQSPLSGFKLSPNVEFSYDRNACNKKARFRWKLLSVFSFCVRVVPKLIDNKEFQLKTEKFFQPLLNKSGMYFSQLGYVPMTYSSKVDNIIAKGTFLSWKYFKEYQDLIRDEFTIQTPIDTQNQEIIDLLQSTNSVCVHIRKGDFCDPRYHMINICGSDYYENAMHKMHEEFPDAIFYIFSNDFQWVEDNLQLEGFKYHLVDINPPTRPLEDLRLMSNCKHYIISNGSYSWWGQFLSTNENKVVYAPKHFVKGKHNRALEWGYQMSGWRYVENLGSESIK